MGEEETQIAILEVTLQKKKQTHSSKNILNVCYK